MKTRFDNLLTSCPDIETDKVELTLRQEPTKKYLVDGNKISFVCCFRSWFNRSEFRDFQWTIDDQAARNNWKQMMIINETYYGVNNAICSNLTFYQISTGSGTIQCAANYSYYNKNRSDLTTDNLSLSLYLCVFPQPFVTINPMTLHVNDSKLFELSCRLTSAVEDEASFSWYEDGYIIDQFCESRNITSQGLNTSSLPMTVRLQSDPIFFSCMADTQLGRTTFGNSTITIFDYNAQYCESEYDDVRSMNWVIKKVRSIDEQLCPNVTTGTCTRMCSINETSHPVWDSPNCTMCVAQPYRNILQMLTEIKADENKTTAAVKIAKSLFKTIMNETEGLTQFNLNATLVVIDTLANWRQKENAGNDEITSIVNVISNVLQPNNSGAWKLLQRENNTVTAVLLKSADIYGRSLSKALNGTGSKPINTSNMALEARSVNKTELTENDRLEFSFPSIWDETRGDKISISTKTLDDSFSSENKTNMSKLNIWSLYYRNIDAYLPSNDVSEVVSRVMSLTVDGLENEQNLSEPVNITLYHNKAKRRTYGRTCAFWNFKHVTGGEWDSTGCKQVSTSKTHTVCSCYHLTNFAILMSRNASDADALSTLSTIGCSISVAALILTVIVYVVNWKQWKSDQAAVLINLCVALIVANTIFLAGADKTGDKIVCKAVSILLHYFFLAAFFLMLAEGVELLLYIIFVFHVRRKIETASLIAAAWGLPLIIVIISITVAGTDEYISERDTPTEICWLSAKHGLIWAFVGPAVCITVINFLILVIILRRISRSRFASAEVAKKRNKLSATFWNLSVICPMLGVSWAFGVLSISFEHEVFQYIFVIANSLQGLLIFLFQVVLRKNKISETCFKPKKRKPVSTTRQTPIPKMEEVEEKKKGGVAQLVSFFQDLEKSGSFDASQVFSTTISLSTTDQSQTNDSEFSIADEVHGISSSSSSSSSSNRKASPSTSAPDGVVVPKLPIIQESKASRSTSVPDGVVVPKLPIIQESKASQSTSVPDGVVVPKLPTIQESKASPCTSVPPVPDGVVVPKLPTIQENEQ